MKQFILSLLLSGALASNSQNTLKPFINLQMAEGDGSNSGSVVWNPVTKKYYTTMIGNAIYAMSVFDVKGKVLQQNVDAEHDYRGMWYNPISRRIEFNCYDSGGIGHLTLNKIGLIDSKVIDFEGMNQPQDQNVGTYYTPGNHIIYLNTATYEVEKYNAKTGQNAGVLTQIRVGCKTKKDAEELDLDTESSRWESRNINSVIYTGMPKAELAILNYDDRVIEMYDQKTGLLTKTSKKIPDTVTIHPNFNFSYSNGMWWFFNKDERKWVGCK